MYGSQGWESLKVGQDQVSLISLIIYFPCVDHNSELTRSGEIDWALEPVHWCLPLSAPGQVGRACANDEAEEE